MPTYEYICKACDHEFEREQRINDAPVKTCPACGARQARRLISRTSFVLKGGGWYSDLYASSSGSSSATESDSDAKGAASSDSAGASSSDDKGKGKGKGKNKGKDRDKGRKKDAGDSSSKPDKGTSSQAAA